jgi:ERCC4-type nuclease
MDPAAIVLLVDDKEEAESIAQEVRRNGTRIVIRPYSTGDVSGRTRIPATRSG